MEENVKKKQMTCDRCGYQELLDNDDDLYAMWTDVFYRGPHGGGPYHLCLKCANRALKKVARKA